MIHIFTLAYDTHVQQPLVCFNIHLFPLCVFFLCLTSPRSPVHGHQSQIFDQISLASFIGVYGTLPNCREERGSRISLNSRLSLKSTDVSRTEKQPRWQHNQPPTQRKVEIACSVGLQVPLAGYHVSIDHLCTFALCISGIYIITCL